MKLSKTILITAIGGCLALYLIMPTPSYAAGWTYEIEPYGLFSSIEGDASVGRITGAPVDVGFDDILKNLDLGAMLHFEAHNENGWGLALDYGFMSLGADITGPRGGVADVGVRQGVFEALLVRRKELAGGQLDTVFWIALVGQRCRLNHCSGGASWKHSSRCRRRLDRPGGWRSMDGEYQSTLEIYRAWRRRRV